MRCKTHAFDNTRFFVGHSEGGSESGGDGWVRITAKGRREYVPGIDPDRSALVIVDLQKGYDVWIEMMATYSEYLSEAFARRLADVVVPNVARLLDFFREKGMLVVYLTLTPSRIMDEVAPREGEVVVTKYSSGAFATSTLDNLLREHGIATIFAVGTDTCGCVDGTISEAYDRSYQTILIEDACCSVRPDTHEAAVKIWAYKGFVRSTDQVIDDYPWQCWIQPGTTGR